MKRSQFAKYQKKMIRKISARPLKPPKPLGRGQVVQAAMEAELEMFNEFMDPVDMEEVDGVWMINIVEMRRHMEDFTEEQQEALDRIWSRHKVGGGEAPVWVTTY